mgnify:CR=1 FL=1
MLQGYSSQISTCPSGRSSFCGGVCHRGISFGSKGDAGVCPHRGGYPHEQRETYSATQLRLQGLEASGRKSRVFMLSINGLNGFYYLRDFHDMRCKYERVLSIIHQQLNQERIDSLMDKLDKVAESELAAHEASTLLRGQLLMNLLKGSCLLHPAK